MPWFEDVTSQSQIQFRHTDGSIGQYYVIEPFTGAVALFDYDGDGFEDIYFLNGATLPRVGDEWFDPPTGDSPKNQLYRNNGDWTFSNVTDLAGVGDTGYGMGVCCGDFDNDGDSDLFVSNFGPNALYINNGDGTFYKATSKLGVESERRFGAGAVFFDIEGDGDLDLYCANYQEFSFADHLERFIGEHQFHPGPKDYPAARDQLFRNEGDGTFTEISESAGIAQVAGTGMGVIAADFDRDGDCDLFVANDTNPNFYFVNDGQGHFTEQGVLAGLALDGQGKPNGNMGVEVRDLDQDGWLDLVTTTYQDEMPVVYLSLGGDFFADETNRVRLERALYAHVHWGLGLEDFDNDGLTDLFIACGHFMDNVAYIRDTTQMKVRNFLLRNLGNTRFQTVQALAGSGLDLVESSRAAGFADLDRDGAMDIVVVNANQSPSILRNRFQANAKSPNPWLEVRLIGVRSNRDAAGALVEVQSVGGEVASQLASVHLGRGYQSHYGQSLHFGLAEGTKEVEITVHWPSGEVTKCKSALLNQTIVLIE